MTTTLNPNGRARKSLAGQIDRLDSMLDGLADNLNEAVAQAVTEAVGAAVREAVATVLAEMLTNPQILAALRGPQMSPKPVAAARPSALHRWAKISIGWVLRLVQGLCLLGLSYWQGLRQASVQAAEVASAQATQVVGQTRQRLRQAWQLVGYLPLFKVPLAAALATGIVLGLIAYVAQPWVAAGLSGLGAFGTALAVQAGWWLRRWFVPVR